MTIRTRILLAVVPVFLLLALVGNGVRYALERRAILNGLHEQAGTYAASIAAFVRDNDLQALAAGRGDDSSLPAALLKLARWESLHGLRVWRPADRETLYLWQDADVIPFPEPAHLAALAEGRPFATRDLIKSVPDAPVVVAYAPLGRPGQPDTALLGVSVDASLLFRELAVLRRQMKVITLFVTGLGVILALVLAFRLAYELRHLAAAAASLESGQYRPPPPGRIAEVADAGEILGVLADVIGEVRARSHRALVENEQFRTETDLLRILHGEFLGPVVSTRAGLTVGALTVGADPRLFREIGREGPTGCLCFGLVRGPSELDTATIASSTGREIIERLERGDPPAEALAATVQLFPLERVTLLTWNAQAGVEQWVWLEGTMTSVAFTWPDTGECVVHDLPESTTPAIDDYLRNFPDEEAVQRLRDLALLAGSAAGTAVLLRRG